MTTTIGTIIALITFLFFIGGLGWKLATELSSIRIMIAQFIAKAEVKFEIFDKLEKRIEKLEDKCFNHDHKDTHNE